uniref:G domain-containing protein n=1 Tax=Parastrongyloides trichosuri TaxID=131310 RepID=A0A0N4ZI63_PARTI
MSCICGRKKRQNKQNNNPRSSVTVNDFSQLSEQEQEQSNIVVDKIINSSDVVNSVNNFNSPNNVLPHVPTFEEIQEDINRVRRNSEVLYASIHKNDSVGDIIGYVNSLNTTEKNSKLITLTKKKEEEKVNYIDLIFNNKEESTTNITNIHEDIHILSKEPEIETIDITSSVTINDNKTPDEHDDCFLENEDNQVSSNIMVQGEKYNDDSITNDTIFSHFNDKSNNLENDKHDKDIECNKNNSCTNYTIDKNTFSEKVTSDYLISSNDHVLIENLDGTKNVEKISITNNGNDKLILNEPLIKIPSDKIPKELNYKVHLNIKNYTEITVNQLKLGAKFLQKRQNLLFFQPVIEERGLIPLTNIQFISVGGRQRESSYDKTLLLFSPLGSGKTSFLNGICNFIYTSEDENDIRFVIFNPSDLKPTTEVTIYEFNNSILPYKLRIIDTPGIHKDRSGFNYRILYKNVFKPYINAYKKFKLDSTILLFRMEDIPFEHYLVREMNGLYKLLDYKHHKSNIVSILTDYVSFCNVDYRNYLKRNDTKIVFDKVFLIHSQYYEDCKNWNTPLRHKVSIKETISELNKFIQSLEETEKVLSLVQRKRNQT